MSRNNDTYRLWQHNNGTFYIMWSSRTAPTSGNGYAFSKRVSTWTTDRKAAEQYRAQFIADLNNPAPPAEPTVGYLLDRYNNEHGVNTRSPVTVENCLKALKPFFGALLPRQVTNQLLRQYAASTQEASAGSILRRLGVLKAALRYAAGNRWIEPIPPLRMPVGHPPPRDIWLTREQVGTLIDTAHSPHLKLFIKLAVSTAARSGALLDLKWEQVNMESRIIDFGRGWGNKRRAIVPMNDDVYEALLTAQTLAQTNHVIEYNGKPVKSIKGGFRKLCIECCIKASPHALRHTAATWLVMGGVPLAEVARLLGNSEAMVEKVYGKHSPDYLRRAVSVLSSKKPEMLQV